MSTGDKIRYFRELRGLNKKQLGIKLGFLPATASVRITQYESNQKKPKFETLLKIAEALQVDISSLDDTDLTSAKIVMQTLFEIEDKYSINIEKKQNDFIISFENLTEQDLELQGFLSAWLAHRTKTNLNLESQYDYNLWRSRFPLDIEEKERTIDELINQKYNLITEQLKTDNFSISKLSHFAKIIWYLRNILTSIRIYPNKTTAAFGIISFDDNELLSLDEETNVEYAKFLLSVDYLNSLNIKVEKRKHTCEEKNYKDFYIYEAPCWTIVTSIEEILAIDDKEEAKMKYNSFLNLFNVPIIDYRR